MKKLERRAMKMILGGTGDGPCILSACVATPPVCTNGGKPELESYCASRTLAQYWCCPKVGD